MFNLSKSYLSSFDYLDALRRKGTYLSIESPLDVPSIIARNHLKSEYSALRLSKTGVILDKVAYIECCPKPLSTIYLFGPDLMGEKEAVQRSGFFMCFPQNWDKINGHGWSSESLGLNTAKISELTSRFEYYDWLQEAAARIDQLATPEVIRMAYDFTFHRSKPDGSMRAIGLEAFSKTAVNTIARNFMRANANRLLRDGLQCFPEGTVSIYRIENDLNEAGFSDDDCLKIGPSNNLLTYLAIHFLNTFGWKANIRALSYLLACWYLRSKTLLREKKKLLKQSVNINLNLVEAIQAQIQSDQEETERLEKSAFKFVTRSVDSLIDQEAVADIGSAYVVLGDTVLSDFAKVTMDPHEYNSLYSSTLENVREIHKLTRKPTRQHVKRPPQSSYRKPIVHIASTCYDFRDLRQEVKQALREWGYTARLNEDAEFPVKVGVSSYQACLEAVKQSDCLVLIIGTRYGGEVQNLGISITELEYRTACEKRIPRINFCLDTVWNLVQVRRNNPNLNYPKYFSEGKEKADKIFEFLDRVRKYEVGKTDNWVHRFKDSLELKEILRKQLKGMKLRAFLNS